VILLDGAGYDVARNLAGATGIGRGIYARAFGTDPARQRQLSPVTHAGAPDTPDWLILHVAHRAASSDQSRLLAERLTAAGARAQVVPVANTDHGRLNRALGTDGDPATAAVAAFLDRLF
jgi:arylformamidase